MPVAAIVQIFHEANTFTPITASYDDFLSSRFYTGEAARKELLVSKNWISGVARGLAAHGYDVEFGLCGSARPGGTLDRHSFDRLKQELIASLVDIMTRQRLDFVALLLHGALSVEQLSAPETEIAQAVRDLVGPEVPIATALDFHANVEPGLMGIPDTVIGGKLYPHSDTFERGARLIELALAPRRLRSLCFRLPMVAPLSAQSSELAHMAEIVALSTRLEQDEGIADVCFMGGFPYVDSDIVGSSVLITGWDQDAMAAAFRTLAAAVWERRSEFLRPSPSFEMIREEIFAAARLGRVVVADIGDNPGSGGLADQADVIQALCQQPLAFVAGFVVDGAAVEAARRAGVGQRAVIPVGRLKSGEPLLVDAVVERLGDVQYRNEGANMFGEKMTGGPGVVLRAGLAFDSHICIVTERLQAFDTQAFRSQGIDIESKAIIYLKSANHFRTSFTPLAGGGVFLVDGGGYASTDIRQFRFTRRAADILPLTDLGKQDWDRMIAQECALATRDNSQTQETGRKDSQQCT